ncbi:uncharacterized protein LOC109795756 isoform X2 [Cajanus cajan]|nr:uncharacterized protein LOC109795756 isoform X2 [Cajanus cajan]
MMKKSPEHQGSGFDLHKDFSQFCEEAKQNVNEAKVRSSSVHPEEYGKTGLEKVKKSWKSCLTSWWSKHPKEPTNNNNCESKVYVKRMGHVSGPTIYNCGKGPDPDVKYRRPNSGPLFKFTKREESQIPYVSLHQQNCPPAASHNYGPLYVVT